MTFPDFLDINEYVYDKTLQPEIPVKMSYANIAKK